MSPKYRSHLKSLFFFVVWIHFRRFVELSSFRFCWPPWDSKFNCAVIWASWNYRTAVHHMNIKQLLPFSIHKFVSDIKLHQKKSLAWRQHTLDIQWLELQVLPSPLISTMRLSNNQNPWKISQKNYAVWSGFYAFWLGFYAVSFSFHWDSKFMPRRSCVIQPNSLFDVHFTCYFGTITQIIDYKKYYGIVVSYRR